MRIGHHVVVGLPSALLFVLPVAAFEESTRRSIGERRERASNLPNLAGVVRVRSFSVRHKCWRSLAPLPSRVERVPGHKTIISAEQKRSKIEHNHNAPSTIVTTQHHHSRPPPLSLSSIVTISTKNNSATLSSQWAQPNKSYFN